MSDELMFPETFTAPFYNGIPFVHYSVTYFLWPSYVIGQAVIFLPCGFFFLLLSFFFF